MLIGQTVALRPVEPGDVGLLTSWWNDPQAFEADEARWPVRAADLQARVAKKPKHQQTGEFLVVLADTLRTEHETVVGHVSYSVPSRISALRCFEIGFSTHPDHRRKGYATMAGRLLVNQLFNATDVHRIQAHCRTTSTASQRAMERMGMTSEGTLRHAVFVAGTYQDIYLYSILRPEWQNAESYAQRVGPL